MNSSFIFTLVLLVGVAVQPIHRTQAKNSGEEPAVRLTVETYLHGLKFNDVESLRKVFHPDAKLLFGRKNGELGALTQEQWYKGFAASAGKEEKGELRIAAMDITGTAAEVKVVEIYETSIYTDYISLLKLADGWKIVNKIFVTEKRAAQ